MVESTTLQDAAALLTVSMDASSTQELRDLVAEFRLKDDSDDLMLAVVALCRSLCMVTAKLVHVIDDVLTDDEANALSDDDLLPMAMNVVRSYAQVAARAVDATDLKH